MKLEHIAIWVDDLEESKAFYIKYFDMVSNEKYESSRHPFSSYFLTFQQEDSARIELMQRPDVQINQSKERGMLQGYAHIAISVGSKEKVDLLTEQIRADGHTVIGEPRTTGDGYYESIVEDIEGNWIEITI